MPTRRSLNVLDRFQRAYHRATGDEDPALYRSAALAIERLRGSAPPDGVFWMALAERLHRKDHRVAWMLDAHDGGFHTRVVRQHYNMAFSDPITELQVTMAKKQHFENGEVRDGVSGEDDEDGYDCPNGCGPNEWCPDCLKHKSNNASV